MTKSMNRSPYWISALAGIVLVVAGGVQLVYGTLMIVSAFAAASVDLGAILLQGMGQMGRTNPEITGAEAARAFANAALNIGIYGLGLGVGAIVSGVLVMVRRELALYGILGLIVLCLLLAIFHWSIAWYGCTAIYVAFGVLFTGFSVSEFAGRFSAPQRSTPVGKS